MKRCKRCGSTRLIKAGIHTNTKGHFQKWKCKKCGHIQKGGKVRENGWHETRKIGRRR